MQRSLAPPVWFVDGAWRARQPPPDPAAAALRALKLVTWNVWFGAYRFDARGVALRAELARRAPDVIALQEVTPPLLDALLAEPWVRAGYAVSELEVLGYDVVLLARTPVTSLLEIALPSQMGRRVLVARLACGLDVATAHLESTAECAADRALQLRVLQPQLVERGDDTVFVGDMNFAPDAILENRSLDPAFVDVWPALHPDDPGYSVDASRNIMRRHSSGSEVRKRIDRVFLRSRRWRAASIELVGTAAIDAANTFTSDHFGLEVVLRAEP